MPLIVKGEFKTVEQQTPPVKPVKIVEPVVRKEVVAETTEQPSNYHHDIDGDLHKLINKNSDYLKDMLNFQSNK